MLKAVLLKLTIFAALGAPWSVHAEDAASEEQLKAYDQALANGQGAEYAQKAFEEAGWKVRHKVAVEGQPYRIVFINGNEIGFKLKVVFSPLHSSIVLSDNSCTRAIGTKGDFLVPAVLRSLIPYWIKHPVYQGRPVLEYDSSDKKDKIKASTAFLTRLMESDFDAQLATVPAHAVEDQKVFAQAKVTRDAFGWMECPGDCKNLLPKNKEVLFWDENFEITNDQARMSRRQEEPSFNQMTSRLQQLRLTLVNNRVTFGNPQKAFGPLSLFLPPGITYQVQWTFRDANLVEPDDEFCQMKWDLDFTRVFTQFTRASESVQDVDKMNINMYPVYNYETSDQGRLLFSEAMTESPFEGSDVRK